MVSSNHITICKPLVSYIFVPQYLLGELYLAQLSVNGKKICALELKLLYGSRNTSVHTQIHHHLLVSRLAHSPNQKVAHSVDWNKSLHVRIEVVSTIIEINLQQTIQ
jgi:hypothetical protein